jgi:uncharacterized protein (DUF4415 family)
VAAGAAVEEIESHLARLRFRLQGCVRIAPIPPPSNHVDSLRLPEKRKCSWVGSRNDFRDTCEEAAKSRDNRESSLENPVRVDAMRRTYDFSKAKRGAVVSTPAGKTRITIRVDDDVLEWFKAQVHASGGGNYQSLINAALRERMKST